MVTDDGTRLLRRSIWALALSVLIATGVETYGLYWALDAVVDAVVEDKEDQQSIDDKLREHFLRADYETLLKDATSRTSSHPNDLDVLYWLGRTHFTERRFTESETYFRKILELNPGWEESVGHYLSAISAKRTEQ